jgi:hypothetical protein
MYTYIYNLEVYTAEVKKSKALYSQFMVAITTEAIPALEHAAVCKQWGSAEKTKRMQHYTS